MKGLLKFITCGSVDDGKSTLIGHILYDAKLLYTDQEQSLELDSKIGSRGGAIDYSLLLDGLMAEREQGITIDVAYRYFTTDARSFIVADTPGHEEYTRNMAVGASFADLAIILVDASQGVLLQTRRHARICAMMGIEYFVFAVNKMDLVGYSKDRFDEIEREIRKLSRELHLSHTTVIPVSATEGDNVTKKSENMPWYQGEAVLSHLEAVDIVSARDEEGFYMPIQRVCRPDHDFRGFQGEVENGQISIGDEIMALPSREHAHVKSIHVGDKVSDTAQKGQPVTISLDREVDVSRGCVFCAAAKIPVTDSVVADILWMDEEPLTEGKNFFVKIGTRMIPGLVTKIHYAIDVNTGEHKTAGQLKKNEIASCSLELAEKVVADEFHKHKTLGELLLIDRISNQTSACGVITRTLISQDLSQGGGVVREMRAKLKGQTPVAAEFVLGQSNVTEDLVKQVEKGLYLLGKHTYLYAPEEGEDYLTVTAHLLNAGLVVLLLLDADTKSDNIPLEIQSQYYQGWQPKDMSAKDAIDFIRRKSAVSAQLSEEQDFI